MKYIIQFSSGERSIGSQKCAGLIVKKMLMTVLCLVSILNHPASAQTSVDWDVDHLTQIYYRNWSTACMPTSAAMVINYLYGHDFVWNGVKWVEIDVSVPYMTNGQRLYSKGMINGQNDVQLPLLDYLKRWPKNGCWQYFDSWTTYWGPERNERYSCLEEQPPEVDLTETSKDSDNFTMGTTAGNWDALKLILDKFGIYYVPYDKGDFSQEIVLAALERGPLIVSTDFGGVINGHVVVLKGKTDEGNIIVNDPWGDYSINFNPLADGGNVVYTYNILNLDSRWGILIPIEENWDSQHSNHKGFSRNDLFCGSDLDFNYNCTGILSATYDGDGDHDYSKGFDYRSFDELGNEIAKTEGWEYYYHTLYGAFLVCETSGSVEQVTRSAVWESTVRADGRYKLDVGFYATGVNSDRVPYNIYVNDVLKYERTLDQSEIAPGVQGFCWKELHDGLVLYENQILKIEVLNNTDEDNPKKDINVDMVNASHLGPVDMDLVGSFDDGWHKDGSSQSFYDAFLDSEKESHPLGTPSPHTEYGSEYVHDMNGIELQDFYNLNNGFDGPWTALVMGPQGVKLLKEGFRYEWLSNAGWVCFGTPITNEEISGSDIIQKFNNNGNIYIMVWDGTLPVEIEDELGNPVPRSCCTITNNSGLLSSSYTDGAYHSGQKVASFNEAFHLIDGEVYGGFYIVNGGDQIYLDEFTISGDTVIDISDLSSDEIEFNDRVDYVTGDGAFSVFSADLNGDDYYDLVTANVHSNDVSVLMNNGEGGFNPLVHYNVGLSPRSVFAQDLDGDHDYDLIVANEISDNISILKNAGDGTFVSAVYYDVGDQPYDVVSADLDSDGDNDLAVANGTSNNISILKNNGDGTFALPENYDAGHNPISIVAADFNGDGDFDLAVANVVTVDINILINNGDGTFGSAIIYDLADSYFVVGSVVAIDVDNDDDYDLAASITGIDSIYILKNDGLGNFIPGGIFDSGIDGPWKICTSDFDCDGDNDLVVGSANTNAFSVVQNDGFGAFNNIYSFDTIGEIIGVNAEDFDGDNDMDLALTGLNHDTVSVFFNFSDGCFNKRIRAHAVDLSVLPGLPIAGEYFQVWVLVQGYPDEFINDFRIAVLDTTGNLAQIVHGPLSVDLSNGYAGAYAVMISEVGYYNLAVQYSLDGGSNWINFDTDAETDNPLRILADECIRNGAYFLNGVDQYLSVPNHSHLDLGNSDFTIEAWIKMESIRGQSIIDKITSETGYRLELGAGGEGLTIMFRESSTEKTEFKAFDIFTAEDLGVYHYIAVVVSPAIPSAEIYLDGVAQDVTMIEEDATTVGATDIDLHIGGLHVPFEFFHGSIDEVRLSNVARNASEISSQYSSGTELVADEHTIALWHMNGNLTDPMKRVNAKGTSFLDLDVVGESDFADGFNGCGNIITWTSWIEDGVPLCTATETQRFPQVIPDGVGGAIATWEDFRNGNSDIYARRIDASGMVKWTADGVPLCTVTGTQQYPKVTSDGAGGAIATWEDFRNGNYDIYAQRIDAAGVVRWTAGGVPLCMATETQREPQITSDGAGGAIVTWSDNRGSDSDIYTQRINTSGAVQWTMDGVPLCTEMGGNQYSPQITSDGASGAIVTWHDGRAGNWDIYTQRINISGTLQWTMDGVSLCAVTGSQYSPQITSDEAGGAIVTWTDNRGSDSDIYTQRINASGMVLWTADGVPLCTVNGTQSTAQIIFNGVSGAIVTWSDYRDDNFDIYTQRINTSGSIQWAADGVPLCTVTGDQRFPQITSDGMGGAIVTWQDGRAGNLDIYAQLINTAGMVRWALDGVSLCAVIGTQKYPQITSDEAGKAIVIWEDSRSGYYDIYAQNITNITTGLMEVPATTVGLYQNYPNPFNPTTTIKFDLSRPVNVKLNVYNVKGEFIVTIINRYMTEGRKEVVWNGKDARGRSISSGLYFYRLVAGDFVQTRKMVLLR